MELSLCKCLSLCDYVSFLQNIIYLCISLSFCQFCVHARVCVFVNVKQPNVLEVMNTFYSYTSYMTKTFFFKILFTVMTRTFFFKILFQLLSSLTASLSQNLT